MAVAEDCAAEAGEEIDVALAGGIPEERAFAAGHDDGDAGVVTNQNIFSSLDQSCHVGHFLCLTLSNKDRPASIHTSGVGQQKIERLQIEAQAYSSGRTRGIFTVAEGTTLTTPHPPDRQTLPPFWFFLSQNIRKP